jgi:hypothetical protein
MHVQNFLDQHLPHQTHRVSPLIIWDDKAYRMERGICVAQSNHRHQKKWLPEVARIWLVKIPGGKHPAMGVALLSVANFSTVHIQDSWRMGH